jgi:hypothetical protein
MSLCETAGLAATGRLLLVFGLQRRLPADRLRCAPWRGRPLADLKPRRPRHRYNPKRWRPLEL